MAVDGRLVDDVVELEDEEEEMTCRGGSDWSLGEGNGAYFDRPYGGYASSSEDDDNESSE